ncbi:uncharacterized protein LOC113509872 [Galleria mellonella]|uniref:Uncharacterized protein LOC113509872 n=1 Tax=Galleria mellonella TaxID=7137 RepID=A0A6J1WF36_GALME|nr:uncharacterized protein LOC113509872 [Galleria mellonella]
MFKLNIVLVLVFSQYALSQIVKIEQCKLSDAECIKTSQSKFLKEASRGTPDFTLKSTDPYLVPHFAHTFEKEKVQVEFKNVVATGFRNQQVTNSKFTEKNGAIDGEVDHKLDLIITGEVLLKSLESGKQVSGPITIEASLNEKLNYVLSPTTTADNKFKGLTVGAEQKQCNIIGEPKLTSSAELKNALVKELPSKLEDYDGILKDLKRLAVCMVADAVYGVHMENMRVSAADYGVYNNA